LNLLKDINEKLKLTIVLITHEMHVIKEICHRVAVIGGGNIVEEGPVAEVFMHPKQQITREFISTVISHELPPFLADVELSDTPVEGSNLVLRLSFVGDSADEPVMSRLIRDKGVDVNIIYGNIDQIQNTAYGTLIIELSGDDADIQASLDYLHQQKLGVEVIGYVIA
ncbi:MAG: methionine ABC transporter ATP-binding protein, partial [Selenomonadales bacterium]|nr:methionine ABC transporter ATP-binding protein [Selenomonadales bacterium]